MPVQKAVWISSLHCPQKCATAGFHHELSMYVFGKVVSYIGKSGLEVLFGGEQSLFDGRQEVDLMSVQQCTLLFRATACHWLVTAETSSLWYAATSSY